MDELAAWGRAEIEYSAAATTATVALENASAVYDAACNELEPILSRGKDGYGYESAMTEMRIATLEYEKSCDAYDSAIALAETRYHQTLRKLLGIGGVTNAGGLFVRPVY